METYLATAVLVALSLLVGGAVCSTGRRRPEWDWLAPAVGLSAAMLLAWVAVRLPGHGTTAAVALVVAAATSVLGLRGRVAWRQLALGLPPALVVTGLSSLPFVANDRIGVLGESLNDDLAFHLEWADVLAEGGGVVGRIPDGYPVGPHALVGAVTHALGTNAEPVFTGFLLALPIVTALTALAALEDLPRPLRVLAAPVVGLGYLTAALLVQSSFKELLLGSLVLAFAVVLRRAMRRDSSTGRALGLGGLIVVAACTTFSLPALAWFVVGAALAWAAHLLLTQGRAALRTIALVGGGLAGLVVVATVLLQATGFFLAGPGRYTFAKHVPYIVGNLTQPLSPFEALSVWPSQDFRVDPGNGWWRFGVALAALAALVGLMRAVRHRETGLLSVSAGAALIYVTAVLLANSYNAAKALAVLAPVLTATALLGLLASAPGSRRWSRAGPALAALALAWGALAIHSTGTLLRAGLVRPQGQSTDLGRLGGAVRRQVVVFLGNDGYARWELRRARYLYFGTAIGLGRRPGELVALPPSLARRVIVPRSRYGPTVDPERRPLAITRWYELYRTSRRSRRRLVTREGRAPGAVLRCDDRESRSLARRGWLAFVKPEPVVGPARAWLDPEGRRPFTDGTVTLLSPERTLRQELRLPPGRWELSLRYYSSDPLEVRAGGIGERMPAYLADRTSFWRVGSVTSLGRPIEVSVASGENRFIAPQRPAEIFELAAVREDRPGRFVSLRRACGRYADFVTPPRR